MLTLRRIRGALISAPAMHSYLLGLWFVLDVSRRDVHPNPAAAAEFIAILWGGTYLASTMLGRVFSGRIRRGIATTIVLIPVLCFQEIRQFLGSIRSTLPEFSIVVPIIVILVVVGLTVLWRSTRDMSTLHGAMNMSSVIFVVWALLPFVKEAHATGVSGHDVLGLSLHASSVRDTAEPDIYYILLDAYTSPGSLSRFWQFDNSEFLTSLERRGFFIARNSTSRYSTTAQSMASTLNMDTLRRGDEPFQRIDNNLVVRYLQLRNYTIENLSPFDLAGIPAYYTYFTDSRGSSGGLPFYFYHTGPGVLYASLAVERMPEVNLRVLSGLTLASGQTTHSPKFVYAHIMGPHGPFGLRKDGSIIPVLRRGSWNSMGSYLDQLIGINRLLLPVIDTILARSTRDPIIIIQGDHGSRIIPGPENWSESHTILNAYHLPAGGSRLLIPSMSPINSFRVILHYYFHEEIPLAAVGLEPHP